MRIVVTGGAGFIGSALVRHLVACTDHEVLVRSLTMPAISPRLLRFKGHPRYRFAHADICDHSSIADIFLDFDPMRYAFGGRKPCRPVDRRACQFVTNIVGTYVLLESALTHWRSLKHGHAFGFIMFRLTRSMAPLKTTDASPRRPDTIRALIQPQGCI